MVLLINSSINFHLVSGNTYQKMSLKDKTNLLSLTQGELISITGPSGCGKSTFIQRVLGLTKECNSNEILTDYVYFKNSTNILSYHQLRSLSYYVAQDISVMSLPLESNISLSLNPSSWDTARIRNAIESVGFDFDKLKMAFDRFSNTNHTTSDNAPFSGGERKRIGLARALYKNPEIIFLDEPTSGLDPVSEEGLITLLESLKQSACIVAITHSDHLVSRSDKVYAFIPNSNRTS